jgi:hypothetical protein
MSGKSWEIFILTLLCLSMLGCQKTTPSTQKYSPRFPGWQIVRPGFAFQLQLPPGMQAIQKQGIDSFVGEYVSDKLTLSFIYGPHQNRLGAHTEAKNYQSYTTVINGQEAEIAFFQNQDSRQYKYHWVVNIPSVKDSHNGLTIDVDFNDEADRQIVKAIFEPIVINY